MPRIEGARFLDLCAGSGAVGIEALSRGATHATFVDRARNMCGIIEANLDNLSVPEDESEVVCGEAAEFLVRATKRAGHRPWNVVFFDPPYSAKYEPALERIAAGSVLTRDGLLVVEHFHKHKLPDQFDALRRTRVLRQGDSCLSFYEFVGSTDVPSARRA